MSQITVRNIPGPVEARLRQMADASGASLNQTVVRLLEAGTGLAPTTGPKRDLASFTGR
jgi:plasmid stability protein